MSYFMVRTEADISTNRMLAILLAEFGVEVNIDAGTVVRRVDVVGVDPAIAGEVARIQALLDSDPEGIALQTADEQRSEVAEELWHRFVELVPTPEVDQ